MASDRRKAMFGSLVFAAGLDGKITRDEQSRLHRYAERIGLTLAEAKEVIQSVVQDGLKSLKRPKDAATKRAFFERFVKLVRTDGKIDAKEEKFLRTTAPHYGIDEKDLKFLMTAPLLKRDKDPGAASGDEDDGFAVMEEEWELAE